MPGQSPLTPEPADTMTAAIESRLDAVHTARPGVVVSYNPSTQTAEIQPGVGDVSYDENGKRVYEPLPPFKHVPVMFPAGGGHHLWFPLAAGDPGMLVFTSCSMDRYLGGDGKQVDPGDDRKHTLSDAAFYPGGPRPYSKPIPGLATDHSSFGADAGPSVDVTSSEIHAGGTSKLLLADNFMSALDTLIAAIATAVGGVGGTAISGAKTTFDAAVNLNGKTVVLKGS